MVSEHRSIRMAPTQTNRIEILEDSVQELQTSIPELQISLDTRFSEYGQKLEDCFKGQNDLQKSFGMLMAEVKNMGARMESKIEGLQLQQSRQTGEKGDREHSRLSFSGVGSDHHESYETYLENRGENTNWRLRRLEFPIFSGEEPEEWIVKAERSFEFYQMGEKEKLEAAIVGLEGDALNWFRWENKRNPIPSWSSLKKMMLRHFRGRRGGTMMEKWLTVKQEGDVEDYERRFIHFASNVEEEFS